MGAEAACRVRYGDEVSQGKALLETTELIFRGDFRLRIPFTDIASLTADEGELRIAFGHETAVFELGRNAEKWAQTIRNPRGLLDKLGVKAGMRVAVLGFDDAGFLQQLRSRTDDVSEGCLPASPADVIFYGAALLDDLARLPELRDAIAPKGAVWVVSPKGKGAQLKDVEVMAAARASGLVDTKVASFSPTQTALKLVIPVANRT